jgi:putative ABC transport system substrate-binding protein
LIINGHCQRKLLTSSQSRRQARLEALRSMKRRDFIALLGGAAACVSTAATAGQARTPRVGVLVFGYPDPSSFLTGFKDGLRDLGYEEGRSVELIIRSAGGRLSTLSSLATEFVNLQVDIIVALPTTAGIAARQATTEIPIVVEGGDLEAAGLVTSLAHPGGNDWCKCDFR